VSTTTALYTAHCSRCPVRQTLDVASAAVTADDDTVPAWTTQEDEILSEMCARGCTHDEIAHRLPGRSTVAVTKHMFELRQRALLARNDDTTSAIENICLR
jgi:hypothetical protein